MRSYVVLIFLLVIPLMGWSQARRAQSLIEKQKYETAHQLLSNGMAKDSVAASLPYVMASLYLQAPWHLAQLDSAYYFSTLSLRRYDLLNEKQLDKHIKDGFGKSKLIQLKEQIDSLAFEVAKAGNTRQHYQQFIEVHTTARQLDSAIYYRNARAFEHASRVNTLESYHSFLTQYPKAADWPEADARYQLLLYKQQTAHGKLQEFKGFVETYPQSPYVEQAIGHIYNIEAGLNTPAALVKFITTYPASQAARKAMGLLYHLHLQHSKATSFADKYPTLAMGDSLQQVIEQQPHAWLPVWQPPYYQMVNLTEHPLADSLSRVLHFNASLDVAHVLKKNQEMLIGKNGLPFYQSPSFTFLDEQGGFIKIKANGQTLLVHKNGQVVHGKDNAYLLEPFVAFNTNGAWGLKSVTNLEVLPTAYDSIWVENEVFFFKQKKSILVATPLQLYPALDGLPATFPVQADDYEWLTNNLLWVSRGDKEALYTAKLAPLVPPANQRIDLAGQGWSVQQKKEIRVPAFGPWPLHGFAENNHWQLGELSDSLLVKYNYHKTFFPKQASLLGPTAIEMQWGDSTFVYLNDTLRFYKPAGSEVKPLYNQNEKVFYYELLEGKRKTIINHLGKALPLPDYTKATPLNAFFLMVDTGKEKQLYSAQGKLLYANFEGAALLNDTTISVLAQQRFGLLQPFDSVLLEPFATHMLRSVTDTVWVAAEETGLGLVSSTGQRILNPKYEEIVPWTAGWLFVKKDLAWMLYDITKSRFVETGIINFHSLNRKDYPAITYQKGVGIGVFDSKRGIVLHPTFTSVVGAGYQDEWYYMAEKHVEEAGIHIMIYYDENGHKLFQNLLGENSYALLYGKQQ